MECYFDNSATTRVGENVIKTVTKVMTEDFGNPSSKHAKGVQSEVYLKDARQVLAKILKVKEKEILFTSGGTESNNMALIGSALANERAGRHIITTS
ncbi:MAG: aminotransferase class V-fold PLP-dependent enzyme, partial [Lachnospiraceae bacterium]|nr:aminotransferase class V-fold PLP-dependent enzyme [Lachnospiraceae bacterium]